MKRTGVEMLIIDPQNDFYDPNGALPVPGADADGERLGEFIIDNIYKLDDISLTMDTHNKLDVGHQIFWKDRNGKNPTPFTLITHDDLVKGNYRPFRPNLKDKRFGTLMKRMLHYTETLEKGPDLSKNYKINPEKYPLFVWPTHCIFGTWGHNIFNPILNALDEWQIKREGILSYVPKGNNPWTEHYSALKAEVEDLDDPFTLMNVKLVEKLEQVNTLLVSGQALSHCVKFTLIDLINSFGVDSVKKIVILTDTTSPVGGFEKQANEFLDALKNIGVTLAKTTDYVI